MRGVRRSGILDRCPAHAGRIAPCGVLHAADRSIDLNHRYARARSHAGGPLRMVGRAGRKEKRDLNVVIFGATGSAGGCVLRNSLASPAVTEVRAISRHATGVSHSKLREIRHDRFDDYTPVLRAFAEIDACFYCLGKSVQQVSGETEYRAITYEYAMATARALRAQ